MNNMHLLNTERMNVIGSHDMDDPNVWTDILSSFADILTERLQSFAGSSVRCRVSGTRDTNANASPPISRSGLVPIIDFGETLSGEFLISSRAFYQIIGALSGQPVDRPMQRECRPLSRLETLVLADIGELIAASFARALPKVLSTFDPNGYAPHPEVRFGGFQSRRHDRLVHPKRLLAFDMVLDAGGISGGFTLLTPAIRSIVAHQPFEKYSPLRDRWWRRQDQKRKEHASVASLNLSRRLLGFDHERVKALLAGESTAVAAACLRLAPHHLVISYLGTLAPSTASEMIDLLVSHRFPRPSLVSALNRLFSQENCVRGKAAARMRLIRALMPISGEPK